MADDNTLDRAIDLFYEAAYDGEPLAAGDCLGTDEIAMGIAAVLDDLAAAGRLLPSGGEVSTRREWPTAWRHEPGTRQVIAWPDGSRYTGPFVPDPPLTPDEAEAMRAAVWERVRRTLPNGGRPVSSTGEEKADRD